MLNTSKMRFQLLAILRILQRPKVLMFLSVITVFFFLYRSKDPVMLKAHVHFKGIQRSVSFEKGDEVLELRYLIMKALSDTGLDKVPQASVKLLKYDESVHDYVPLHPDLNLEEDVNVIVELSPFQDKVKCILSNECGLGAANTQPATIKSTSTNRPMRYYSVRKDTPYRLWNLASATLLQRDSNNIISCNGSFKDMDYNTVVKTTTKNSSRIAGYGFLFVDKKASKTYIMNATNEGKRLEAVEHTGAIELSMKFTPSSYWGFTIFKSKQYTTLYLGCGNDGRSFLLPMNNKRYPDSRALFITNKYDLISSSHSV